jgi:hypothetical protein
MLPRAVCLTRGAARLGALPVCGAPCLFFDGTQLRLPGSIPGLKSLPCPDCGRPLGQLGFCDGSLQNKVRTVDELHIALI